MFPSFRPSGIEQPRVTPAYKRPFEVFYPLLWDSFHSRRSVCVAVVTAICLLLYRGHLDEIMSKRLLFFIFFCAYVLSGQHGHTGEPQQERQHEDLMYFRASTEKEAEFQRMTSFTAFSRELFFFASQFNLNFTGCELPKSKIWNVLSCVALGVAFHSCRGRTAALRSCLHRVDLIQLVTA